MISKKFHKFEQQYGGRGSASALPAAPGIGQPQGIPANRGGSVVQGVGFYYIYNIIPAASIANGVTSAVTQQFDQVTVFKWVRSTFYCDVGSTMTASSLVLPSVTLQITDSGSGASFMNNPVALFDMAGTGQLPYVLPVPQFIQANAVLQFTFNNFSSATTYTNLTFHMHGCKLYNYNQANISQY